MADAPMLEALRKLSEEVSSAENLDQALRLIVRRVREVIGADACSVYLIDPATTERVLMATEGLRADAVGRVRLRPDEGLVGLVCSRAEPVNVEDAPGHPAYRYFPETGEEAFHGFLGVPIIHQGRTLGALVVQQKERRRFTEDEETLLITLAAQLAAAIAHAEAVTGFDNLAMGRHHDRPFPGVSGAPGVAVGTAVVVYPPFDLAAVPDRTVDDTEAEVRRFLAAVEQVRQDIDRLEARFDRDLPQADRALFEAYRLMLDSDSIVGRTIARIDLGQWAPAALRDTVEEHSRAFRLMDDPYLRERVEDMRDLGRRLLERLEAQPGTPVHFPEAAVLVGDSLGPAAFIDLPLERVRALVSRQGSGSSHAAILARALGIPAVMGVSDLPLAKVQGKTLVVDGYEGRVFVDPSPAVREQFQRLSDEEHELRVELEPLRDLPAVTRDGHRIALFANAGLLSELEPIRDNGADGIGLYRTEFPFMMRDRFPGEGEQTELYRRILERCAPAPVTLRTLDIGGDKSLPYFPIHEDNPFLGWRGLRVCLDHPEIFMVQIRAMVRANAGLGNLHILLPMVTTPAEVDEALHLIGRAHRELQEETGEELPLPRIGAMIEVPSAVSSAAAIARRVDFLSIGTNDLVQYLLAVDRNNHRVAKLYDALHPAVIEAIERVLHAGARYGKPVSVCGEMASDPAAALLLVGLGLDTLSVNAIDIPRIKWVVRNLEYRQARELVDAVRDLEEAHQIRHHLECEIERLGLGGLIRAGK